MTAERRIIDEMLKTGMLQAGDRVIAGISGGADSVFLFYVLKWLREDIDYDLRVIHVHHGIRGEEADRDADFVERLCLRENIPCQIFRRDVPKEAEMKGMSLEEAGRAARYEIFRNEASGKPGTKIALAHHRDDLAETVLFRIARGTGIGGLAAMRPVSGHVIRPLLCLSKEDIVSFLDQKGICYMEDSTNEMDDAVRNRIRHEILPLIRRRVNENAVIHLAQLSATAWEVSSYIREEARKEAEKLVRKDEAGLFIHEDILNCHPALEKEILKDALEAVSGTSSDIRLVHINTMESLLRKREGASGNLPYGIRARRMHDGILMEKNAGRKPLRKQKTPDPVILKLKYGETAATDFENWRFLAEYVREAPDPVPENRYTKWFDYGKMNDTLSVRTRRPGDYLTIDSRGSRKTVSDYFTDMKVPAEERDRIPLLVSGSEIVWVVGMRIGYRFRIGKDTSEILKISTVRKEAGTGHE